MKTLLSLWILMVLFPADSAHKGLFCTNDLVRNVSCSWTSSWTGSDCWISGVKKINKRPKYDLITQHCKMEQHGNSPPGCSFVFEETEFSGSERMPDIRMTCNGTLITNITDYQPSKHVKMHPPGAPHVNITINDTQIRWSLGQPVSYLFKSEFDFQVQVKQNIQSWAESKNFPTQNDQELRIPVSELSGALQARVRVKPINRENSHWSDWSPTTSWVVATYKMDTSTKQKERKKDWWLDWTHQLVMGIFLTLCLIIVVMALYKRCKNRELKGKPVPNPSKYLENIHSGNLKSLLSESELVFIPPCDLISPVEVCEDWEATVPSLSPSSSPNSALLHSQNYPPSNSSGIVYNSSSLSNFSNMGYFMSGSSGHSSRTNPHLAYFTYNDPFHTLPTAPQPPLYDAFSSGLGYESLKRESESPDSGFGIMEEQEKDLNEHTSPFIILSLHLPSHTHPPSSFPPPPCHPPAVPQIFSTRQDLDVSEAAPAAAADAGGSSAAAAAADAGGSSAAAAAAAAGGSSAAAAGGSSAAQPAAAAAMCRSSSMPVEPFKSDYLTLKELQTTFSNKSI